MKTQMLRSLFPIRTVLPLALALCSCLLPAGLRAQSYTNVYNGSGGNQYSAAGSTTIPATTGTPNGINQLTYSFTPPSGVTSVKVECWGGGGGGGGAAKITGNGNVSAGGGGAGAYAISNSMPVTPGNSYTITIPAAAVGGANTGADGDSGTSVSFAADGLNTVTAAFGSGGKGCTVAATPGAGGAGGIGIYNGGAGAAGINTGSGGGGSAPSDTAVGAVGNNTSAVPGATGSDAYPPKDRKGLRREGASSWVRV